MFDDSRIFDVVPQIISYIPKHLILPVALVNKLFYKSISITTDQEIIAQNGDMFSLLKVPYSPKVVINIAARHNHDIIVKYLLSKHNINININNDELSQSIGFSGNQQLISLSNNYSSIINGICEGGHIDLLDNFTEHLKNSYDMIKYSYKTSNTKLIEKTSALCASYKKFGVAKIHGICSNKDYHTIYKFINHLITTIKEDINVNNICYVFDGLIEGGHYNSFKYLSTSTKINTKDYVCNYHIIYYLIRDNNYEFFEYLILNHYITYIQDIMKQCVHYRRSDMLILMTTHYTDYYDSILELAIKLEFDDMINIIITASVIHYDCIDKISDIVHIIEYNIAHNIESNMKNLCSF